MQGIPCLANFGLSSIAREIYSVNGSNAGGEASVRWSAPELVRTITARKGVSVKPNMRSDIYSLAMVIVEVLFCSIFSLKPLRNSSLVIRPSQGESRSRVPPKHMWLSRYPREDDRQNPLRQKTSDLGQRFGSSLKTAGTRTPEKGRILVAFFTVFKL